MIANYHTHTYRCNHATGTEKAYVENAIQRGLKILGFSDHTPYIFPGDYYSTFRMKMNQLEDYVTCIQSLRDRYADKLEIHVGLETEFYPRFFPDLLSVLREHPIEYMILGQHCIRNEVDGAYSGTPTSDPQDLKDYCHQVIHAMESGVFTYVAHPDIINFTGSDSVYQDWMRGLCRESNATGVPLELNLLGLSYGRNYPDRRFLEIVAEEGCSMVLGCDAHTPEALLKTEIEEAGIQLLKEYDIPILETVSFRSIY